MRIAHAAVLCAALALTASRQVQAQTLVADKAPQASRQGFWIGFGFGGGSAGVTCDGCTDERFSGGTARLALGGTVSPNLKIGGESHVWVNTEDSNIDESVGNVSASLYYYPSRTGNVFLQGGVGMSVYSYDDGSMTAEANGLGIILGVGYDIRLGRKFSLTPIFAYSTALSGNLHIDGMDTGFTAKPNFVSLSLSAVWH
jgi:hypothetical protein